MSNRTILEFNHDREWTTSTIATLLDRLRNSTGDTSAIEALRLAGVMYLGTRHHTTPCPMRRIDQLEIALHRIVGHGNITVEKAKQIAAEALGEQTK